MSKYPSRAWLLGALAASAFVSTAAAAQSAYPPYLPRPTTFAGSCTGSTNGGGMNFAGGYSTDVGFDATNRLCDQKEGVGAFSTTSTYPGVSPQHLEAHASIAFGTIKTFAQMNIFNWPNQGLVFPRAVGQAGWVDDIVFNAPGLTGQAGSAIGTIHLSGLLQTFGYQGNAGYSLTAMVGTNYPAVLNQLFIGGGQGNSLPQTVVIDEMVQVALNFIYGTPLAVGVFAYSVTANSAEGGNYPPAGALSDFENTIQWTGLSSVMSGGNAVSNYSVSSASGDDWILGEAAVSVTPEPSAVILMATGLVGFVAIGRRRVR